MCKYCEQPHEKIIAFDDSEASLSIFPNSDEGVTIIHYLPLDNGDFIETEFTADACPMCGQRY